MVMITEFSEPQVIPTQQNSVDTKPDGNKPSNQAKGPGKKYCKTSHLQTEWNTKGYLLNTLIYTSACLCFRPTCYWGILTAYASKKSSWLSRLTLWRIVCLVACLNKTVLSKLSVCFAVFDEFFVWSSVCI